MGSLWFPEALFVEFQSLGDDWLERIERMWILPCQFRLEMIRVMCTYCTCLKLRNGKTKTLGNTAEALVVGAPIVIPSP